jgi:hypothetical protein
MTGTETMKRWLLSALVLVPLLWGSCLAATLWAMKPSEGRNLASYGQAGDVFGSVNALFTGLALIGLVYTASLQRDQTRAQFDQLGAQKVDASRQAREQFLTARLNAQVAALEAATAQQSAVFAASNPTPSGLASVFLEPLNRIGMRIEILALEANQGFDGGAWAPPVEKEAIRQYIVNSLMGAIPKKGDPKRSVG